MEKQHKFAYEVSCNCYDYNDGKDIICGYWNGKIVSYDNNSCVGYAVDSEYNLPYYLLIGIIVDGKSISIWKININNAKDYPKLFHTFANAEADSRGYDDTCYGKMFVKSDIQFLELGTTSIKSTKIDMSEINKIESICGLMIDKVKTEKNFNLTFLEMIDFLDISEYSKYMLEGAQLTYQDKLPDELLDEIYIQPNNE